MPPSTPRTYQISGDSDIVLVSDDGSDTELTPVKHVNIASSYDF